jgi:hypothetical protein
MEYQPTPEEQALFPNLTEAEFYRCVDQNQCTPELGACDEGSVCLSTGVCSPQATDRQITIKLLHYISDIASWSDACVCKVCDSFDWRERVIVTHMQVSDIGECCIYKIKE